MGTWNKAVPHKLKSCMFAAVYLVFAFQHCPDGNVSNVVASSLASDGKTSKKRTHQDCDSSHVEKERLRGDGL